MLYCGKINRTDIQYDYLQKIYLEKGWAWWVNHIGTFVVFIIGFLGNMLCLVFLCRRPFIRNSYTQYLITLAIVDTGAISSETLVAFDSFIQYQSNGKQTLFQHTTLSCKLYYYVRFILYSMSSWIVVVLAVERLVAIKYPLWSKYICSVTNARRIICLMFLFTMSIQSYQLFVKGIDCSAAITSTQICRCKTLPAFIEVDIFFTIYFWRLFLMTLIPLIIIITVNVLIMNKLFHKNSFMDYRNRADHTHRKAVLRYRISRMLVIVSSIYLLLHVPGSTLEIIKSIFGHALKLCRPKWNYYIHITQHIFDLLTNCNYGINFYLYIISSKHIRSALLHGQGIFHFAPFKYRSSSQRSKHFLSSYIYSSRRSRVTTFNKGLVRGETISSI
ncbi:unnamed protein product [Adineta ricciae]|uniref:G-protein coupled receptors family 1 profile domain-containing protein n=1 Tax=Adineta ricciae TaxID=249248 RepID=A0A815QN59_ADIRI|nr:unnamed protein product [Adineta ricciae]